MVLRMISKWSIVVLFISVYVTSLRFNARPWFRLGSNSLDKMTQRGSSHLQASTDDYDDKMLSFSSKMDITMELPTTNHSLAGAFLENERKILDETWSRSNYVLLDRDKKKYRLTFPPIVLPGVDTILTTIDVRFEYQDGKITLISDNWTLKGKSGAILKDSRFVQSFNVEIKGELSVKEAPVIQASAIKAEQLRVPAPPVTAHGWVKYAVEGKKPKIFQQAPDIVLNTSIKLIKETVRDFASNQFRKKFLTAFRSYLIDVMNKQAIAKRREMMLEKKKKAQGQKMEK